MKIKNCALLIFLVTAAFPLAAQHFKPYSILRVLRTEHFEIIYSTGSEKTARKLAERADAVYENISALTGIALDRRVPVVVTPETDEHNGYMNPMPYPHIVLFDTPASIEWTVFTNSIESLFLHEMTHAVTISTRGKAEDVLYRIFGGWVYPSGINAPWFMIEGAAVSFESLDGTGRSNDPLIKQKLRQDILEGSFKTPFQASGVWDMPPGGSTYYNYGGLFSAYLQKKYGMEKYGELWREMGRRFHVSPVFYNSGFYNIFKRVYGISITQCWNDFKESLSVDGIEENASGVIYGGKSAVKDIACAAGKIFFIDNLAAKIIVYDTSTKKIKNAVSIDRAAYALDVSEDGERILVSTYKRLGANSGQFSRALVVEYGASNGLRTGREWNGLYNARYFRDGIAALNSDTHISNLVYRQDGDKNGSEEEILLSGSETLLFSNPSPLNDEWIAFTSAKSGARELSLFNYKTHSVYTLHSGLESDADIWRYMRGLRFTNGRLYFSYNDDDRMYKLASVSINSLTDGVNMDDGANFSADAYFSDTDFSGGVFYPVSSGNTVYYGAAFSLWDKILTFPKTVQEFERGGVPLDIVPWQNEWIITSETYNKIDAARTPESRLYNPVKYFNPLNLWIPFPLINPIAASILAGDTNSSFDNLSFDGGGIFSYISDPMDHNMIFLAAAYNFRDKSFPVNITWMNFSLMFPLTLTFYDAVPVSDVFSPRKTRLSVQGSYRIPLGNERLSLTLSGMFSSLWMSYNEKDGGDDTGYLSSQSVQGGIRLSNIMQNTWERFGNGVSERFLVKKTLIADNDFRFENIVTGALESVRALQDVPVARNFAVYGALYGVYDTNGIKNNLGRSAYYTSSAFDSVSAYEYGPALYNNKYSWLAGGEFDFSPVSIEIQKNLSHLYFNRVYASAGYRWACLNPGDRLEPPASGLEESPLIHSVIFRLSGVVSILPITALPIKMTFDLLGALRLSLLDNGFPGDDFYIGWGFSTSY
ncbi:MAG: hypothetical protein LBP37_05305 [Spirochaetaceae bacterium]|nr:hypothetical protein [Spirochaetaceae bacterium]